MTTPYISSKRHKGCKFLFWGLILGLLLLLCGCAKTATETITDAAMQQVNIIEETIKKDCPMLEVSKYIQPLKTTINAQLATCEAEKEKMQETINFWKVVSFAMVVLIAMYIAFKIL